MADYPIGPFDIDIRFRYEEMLEKNAVDLSQYEYDDIHLPYVFLADNHRNDEYVTELYKKCIQEDKPWQEYVQPVKVNKDVLY